MAHSISKARPFQGQEPPAKRQKTEEVVDPFSSDYDPFSFDPFNKDEILANDENDIDNELDDEILPNHADIPDDESSAYLGESSESDENNEAVVIGKEDAGQKSTELDPKENAESSSKTILSNERVSCRIQDGIQGLNPWRKSKEEQSKMESKEEQTSEKNILQLVFHHESMSRSVLQKMMNMRNYKAILDLIKKIVGATDENGNYNISSKNSKKFGRPILANPFLGINLPVPRLKYSEDPSDPGKRVPDPDNPNYTVEENERFSRFKAEFANNLLQLDARSVAKVHMSEGKGCVVVKFFESKAALNLIELTQKDKNMFKHFLTGFHTYNRGDKHKPNKKAENKKVTPGNSKGNTGNNTAKGNISQNFNNNMMMNFTNPMMMNPQMMGTNMKMNPHMFGTNMSMAMTPAMIQMQIQHQQMQFNQQKMQMTQMNPAMMQMQFTEKQKQTMLMQQPETAAQPQTAKGNPAMMQMQLNQEQQTNQTQMQMPQMTPAVTQLQFSEQQMQQMMMQQRFNKLP